ncbi:MAG: amino acid permease [Gaiellales bacterium]
MVLKLSAPSDRSPVVRRRQPRAQPPRGVADLVLSAFPACGSGVFVALGLTASYALGWSPLVMLVVAVMFCGIALSSMEGAAMFPEDGVASSLVRHAFNDLASFAAGWATVLSLIAAAALAALFAAHYLSPFWSGLASPPWDTVAAVATVLALAAGLAVRVQSSRTSSMFLGLIDIVTQVVVVLVGWAFLFDPSRLRSSLHLSTGVSPQHLVIAAGVASVAFLGVDTVAGLAARSVDANRDVRSAVPRLLASVCPLVLALSLVAMMAMPVVRAPGGAPATLLAKPPPPGYAAYPVFGIVNQVSPHVFAVGLRFATGLAIAAVLVAAAGAALAGAASLAVWLSQHSQLPARVSSAHPEYGTPMVAILAAALAVSVALIAAGGGSGAASLAGLFAYGSMFALAATQLAVARLRRRDPGRHRPFRVPWSIHIRGAELPVIPVLGVGVTATVWAGVVAFDRGPGIAGCLWMMAGLTAYAAYRRRIGLGLSERRRRSSPPVIGPPRVEVEFHTMLVAVDVFQTEGVADAVEVAARLAAERRAVVVLAAFVEIPLSEEMDVELDDLDEAVRELTKTAQGVCSQYGIRLLTAVLRTRDPAATILAEADRRDSGVIIVSAAGLGRSAPRVAAGGGVIQRIMAQAPQRVMVIQPGRVAV